MAEGWKSRHVDRCGISFGGPTKLQRHFHCFIHIRSVFQMILWYSIQPSQVFWRSSHYPWIFHRFLRKVVVPCFFSLLPDPKTTFHLTLEQLCPSEKRPRVMVHGNTVNSPGGKATVLDIGFQYCCNEVRHFQDLWEGEWTAAELWWPCLLVLRLTLSCCYLWAEQGLWIISEMDWCEKGVSRSIRITQMPELQFTSYLYAIWVNYNDCDLTGNPG